VLVAQQHAVVHFALLDIRLHHLPTVFVHGNAHHSEALPLQTLLELDEPGNFHLARFAPRCPEVEQHHFAAIIRKPHGRAVRIFEHKIGRERAILLGFEASGRVQTVY
jgi:hypothetical protein